MPTENDSNYKRNHPKWFYPQIDAEVRRQLEELEQYIALDKDIATLKHLITSKPKRVRFVDEVNLLPKKEVEDYNLAGDILEQPINATFGQLPKQSALYRWQIREAIIGKQKKR